jgi:hypothetical protein
LAGFERAVAAARGGRVISAALVYLYVCRYISISIYTRAARAAFALINQPRVLKLLKSQIEEVGGGGGARCPEFEH